MTLLLLSRRLPLALARRQALPLRRSFHRSAAAWLPEIPFKLADIGEGIAEVELLQWFVNEGDKITQFQNVCEVQSDKATVEITSRYDGVVKKVHYTVGEMAKVGQTLIDIEVDDATAAAFHAATPSKPVATTPTLARRAAPTPVAAPARPPLPPAAVQVAVDVAVPSQAPSRQPRDADERVLTSPSVRRLAKEHSIDLLEVIGTGPDGRLLKEDLLNHIRMLASQPKIELVQLPTATAKATTTMGGSVQASASYLAEDTVVPLTRTYRALLAQPTRSCW